MASRFGCIGCGNMGAAILRGLVDMKDLELLGYDADQDKVKQLEADLGVKAMSSVHQIVEQADYLLVAVKPNQVRHLLEDCASRLRPSQVLLSIAAGVTLTQLKTWSSGVCPVVRVMPNTPAMVQQGVFAICLEDPTLKDAHKSFVMDLFSILGQAHELGEKNFDAFTAIVGSGPAYVFYVMEALVEAGVTLGMQRPQATQMVKGLFSGSAALAEKSDLHLSVLREMVTSPAGTTIAGTNVLDAMAVRSALVEAVEAACQRSKELGM